MTNPRWFVRTAEKVGPHESSRGTGSAERRGRDVAIAAARRRRRKRGRGQTPFGNCVFPPATELADEAQGRNRRATAPGTRVPALHRPRRPRRVNQFESSFSPFCSLFTFLRLCLFLSRKRRRFVSVASEKANAGVLVYVRSRLRFSLSFDHCRTHKLRHNGVGGGGDANWTAKRIGAHAKIVTRT